MQKLPRKDSIHTPMQVLRAPFPARSRLHEGQDGAGRRGDSCPTSAGPAAPCSPLPGLCLPEQSRQRPQALQAGRGQRFSRRRHRPPRPGPLRAEMAAVPPRRAGRALRGRRQNGRAASDTDSLFVSFSLPGPYLSLDFPFPSAAFPRRKLTAAPAPVAHFLLLATHLAPCALGGTRL